MKADLLVLFGVLGIFGLSEAISDLSGISEFYFPDPANPGQLIPAKLGLPVDRAWTPNVTDVRFFLLTNNNIDAEDELVFDDIDVLGSSHFIKNAPLKVMAHGFGGSSKDGFPQRIAKAYVERGEDINVIMVDWERLATSPWYNIAAPSSRFVGEHVGAFIQFLIDEGFTRLEDVHLIGFSLGAQVVANIGRYLGGRVPRVTGLDPALPFFDVTLDDYRLDPTDGIFVDVIHTDGGYLTQNHLAFEAPVGHVDFYPNSGANQPGCEAELFGSCSHGRAPYYFEESIKDPTALPACACDSWSRFLAGKCDCSAQNRTQMGDYVNETVRGKYYLITGAQRPFALGMNGVTGAGGPGPTNMSPSLVVILTFTAFWIKNLVH